MFAAGECPKPARLKAFRKTGFRLPKEISSQARYDHFDTLPYSQRIIFYQTKRDLSNNICNIRLNVLKYFSKARWGNANLQCLSEKVQC